MKQRMRIFVPAFALVPLIPLLPLAMIAGCGTTVKPPHDVLARSKPLPASISWSSAPLHRACTDCVTPTPKTLAQAHFVPTIEHAIAAESARLVASRPLVELPKVAPIDPIRNDTPHKSLAATKATFLYATASAKPLKVQPEKIAALIAQMKSNPRARLVVTGHADSTGEAAANERLSVRRAIYLKQFLVRQGLDATRIMVRSAPFKYVESNAKDYQRAMNRRATVELIAATS
jgi:outer membrane protein OmpA-like peptidoglycan-associated protein